METIFLSVGGRSNVLAIHLIEEAWYFPEPTKEEIEASRQETEFPRTESLLVLTMAGRDTSFRVHGNDADRTWEAIQRMTWRS